MKSLAVSILALVCCVILAEVSVAFQIRAQLPTRTRSFEASNKRCSSSRTCGILRPVPSPPSIQPSRYGWVSLQEKSTDREENSFLDSADNKTEAKEKKDDDVGTSAEEEYRQKLKEAQDAFAAAEEARQKLLQQKQESNTKDDVSLDSLDILNADDAPKLEFDLDDDEEEMAMLSPFSRAELSYTDAQTLEVILPPQNVGMNTLFTGAFSLAWFSAVMPATFAVRGAAALLFMLPFWVAGGIVAKAGVVDPLVRQKFTMGQYAWSVTKEIAGQTIQKVERPTERLQRVQLRLIDYVNEVPRYELQLQLSGEYDKKSNDCSFGLWVGEENLDEARELLEVINRQLEKFRRSEGERLQ